MFLSEYGLTPTKVDDELTGNDVYMILYQRLADQINQEWKEFNSQRNKGKTMSKEDFLRQFASKVG